MEARKTKRIRDLKNEVNDLHPLLKALFPKLPEIIEVEYTQGTSEMGADFVLTRRNTTLDDFEYIGCIVKVGQIKQDHSEVCRQIEECEVERTIQGGKRKVFLNEIWIISNGNITNGAQTKIHHKYKNKNIKFIEEEKLTSLVDKFLPDFWTDVSVQAGEYLRELKHYASNISKNNSLVSVTFDDIYIPQQLVRIRTKRNIYEDSNILSKKTNIDSVLEKEDFVIIEAMMGAGKSMLLAELAKYYADNETFLERKVLPIIISSTELLEKYDGDISQLTETFTNKQGYNDVEQLLVLIDGLDELKISNSDRLEFLSKIFQTSQSCSNSLKVVISTRPIDDPEVEHEIEKSYARYRLTNLTVNQVISLVDRICRNVDIKNKLLKDLDKSQLFKVLPKTPISAILLAKLLNENIQEIPATMTDLYNKYMELSLGRWDMEKGLQSQQEYDVIRNVTIDIATFVMTHSLNEISIGDCRELYDSYIDNRNLQVIDRELVFKKLINKSEVYISDKQKNTIRFRHRTFAEYFFAEGIIRDNSEKIDESIYDLYWSTSYFFYIGIKRDCPELLKSINKIEFTEEAYRVLKIFNNGNFLLAAYLTPYTVIRELIYDSFKDAAELYVGVVTNKSNSPLSAIPPMQLLCIITHAITETYSYEFFSNFLSEYAYDLCTKNNLTDEEYVELFLINSVRLSLKESDAYDTMINNYGKRIPIQIQAAILEHSKTININSKVVKKYANNFKKRFKTNLGMKQTVLSLYNDSADKIHLVSLT